MMSSVIFYSIRCNSCAFDFQHHGTSIFANFDKAEIEASERGWLIDGKRHYCPSCRGKREHSYR